MAPDRDAVASKWAVPLRHDLANRREPPIACPHLNRVPAIVDIDPRGDRILVVSTNECTIKANGQHGHKEAMRFRVCSRALARSSDVMKAMLFGAFREAGQDQVDLPDDDPQAMQMLLQISHGNLVPIYRETRELTEEDQRHKFVERVYGVVALANKYLMTKLLYPWASTWAAPLRPVERQYLWSRHDNYGTLEKELFIASEFGDVGVYEAVLAKMVWHYDLDTELFPESIEPEGASERIQSARLKIIDAILTPLRNAAATLAIDDPDARRADEIEDRPFYEDSCQPWSCTQASRAARKECEAHTFGHFMRFLVGQKLWPLPDAADVEGSAADLYARVNSFEVWSDRRALHENCAIRSTLADQLELFKVIGQPVLPLPPQAVMEGMLFRQEQFDLEDSGRCQYDAHLQCMHWSAAYPADAGLEYPNFARRYMLQNTQSARLRL